jgi:chromosome partitioning protein
LGALRDTQLYVQCLERGMTIFDLPGQRATADLQQWQPILDWLGPQFVAAQAEPAPSVLSRPMQSRLPSTRTENPMSAPAPRSLGTGDRVTVTRSTDRLATSPVRKVTATVTATPDRTATRQPPPETVEHQQIPSFLRLVKC